MSDTERKSWFTLHRSVTASKDAPSSSDRKIPLALLGVSVLVLVLALSHDSSGLSSPKATQQVLDRLGVHWQHLGPPVILLYGAGCGDCAVMIEQLEHEGVPYEPFDIVHNETAKQVLAEVSRNRFGRPVEAMTPTTIVGTKVIRGPDIKAVVAAVKEQHGW
jgi:hypothetical protein